MTISTWVNPVGGSEAEWWFSLIVLHPDITIYHIENWDTNGLFKQYNSMCMLFFVVFYVFWNVVAPWHFGSY